MTETAVSDESSSQLVRDPPPSEAVVDAVADAEGVDPIALRMPLYEVVDPDALDEFVESTSGECRVEFTYHGYVVTVTGAGIEVARR